MTVLSIGHCTYDITCPINTFPVENQKYRFTQRIEGIGGPACNVALLLGKWGIETYFSGVIGSDNFGSKIKKDLETSNVNTKYLETNYELLTSLSMILVTPNGRRTTLNVGDETNFIKKFEYLITPDIIFMDGHDYNASKFAINKYGQAIKVIDAGRLTKDTIELCKYCNYIIASKDFAEELTKIKIDYNNTQTLVGVYNTLKNRFTNSQIIVTLEEHGALYCNNKQIKVMPGLKMNAVDTTAAGDIFHGAFVYSLANGFDLEKSVTYANIAAGLSTAKLGGSTSIPTVNEVIQKYNEKLTANMPGQMPPNPNQPMMNQMANQNPNNTPNNNPEELL